MQKYSKSFLIELYLGMLKIRQCEESFIDPILSGAIRCPVHLCSGQEAVAVGVCSVLDRKDYIFGGHRSHGHFLAKGGSLKELVAEVYGKSTGCSRGRGGSMHLIDPKCGMLGSAPIVAGTISLAVGGALAAKIQENDRVSVCFFGDGATTEGVLYESMNFAALKQLPVIFICENNLYSTHMPIRKCRNSQDIYSIAEPFDIPSFKIDGNDVLKVYETTVDAYNKCKKGKGPVFIECKTYRLRGHVGPDDNIQGTHTDIRSETEVLEWKRKDPVINFEKWIIQNGILSLDEVSDLKGQIDNEIREAFLFAQKSEYPKKNEVLKYVFK